MLTRLTGILIVILSASLLFVRSESNAQTLYMVEQSSDALWTLDISTGSATQVGPLGVDVNIVGMAYDSVTDTFLVSNGNNSETDDNDLYRVEPTTGSATFIGSTGIRNISGLAFNPSTGLLFGATGSFMDDALYTIDPATASATLVGPLGQNFNVNGLAYDNTSGTLYMNELNTDSLFTVNTSTGTASLVGPNNQGDINIVGLGFNPNTETLFGVGSLVDNLYTVDKATGAATLVGPIANVNAVNTGLAFRSVPEPSVISAFTFLGARWPVS